MKLLVIGHSVEDHIYQDGKKVIKPGGIFYTTLTLINFIDNPDEIYLCTAVNMGNIKLFSPAYELVNKEYFQYVDDIPKVHLNIFKNKEREEVYENLPAGIPHFDAGKSGITRSLDLNLENINTFDGIIINMITGFDITLEQFKEIRNSYKGIIYFDIHTLSRGLEGNIHTGIKRDFRRIPNAKEWITSADIIQANENEILTLSKKTTEKEIADEVLNCGVKYLIVTKQELGSNIYNLDTNRQNMPGDIMKKEIISTYMPAIKVDVKNKVGCGDVFGAIFFYTYLKNKDVNKSLMLANIAGGCSASYDTPDKFKELKKDVSARYN